MFSFLRTIHIDRLSFWLGFLAATLFWWIARNLRGYWPILQQYVRDRLELIRQRNLAGLEGRLRRETLRRAQGMHLAWPLFSLDEILIEPRLLAPPPHIEPGGIQPPDEILSNLLAYLPDWTELPARFGATTLGLMDCLAGGSNLAIIGQPGSGKTVALAKLASQIARREITGPALEKSFPIYFHVADLNLSDQAATDPLAPIIDIYTKTAPVVLLTQIPGFIRSTLKTGKVCMILDGLDELTPVQMKPIVDYIEILMKSFPGHQWIVSASDSYLGGLTRLGFEPIPIAAWGDIEYAGFVEQWSRLWKVIVLPNLDPQDADQAVNPTLLNNWLLANTQHKTPLEFTLEVWSTYVGDPRGPRPVDAIEAYLHRLAPKNNARLALERLAVQMVSTNQATISRNKAGSLVSEFELASIPTASEGLESDPNFAPALSQQEPVPSSTPPVGVEKAASISRILPELTDNGLVVERLNETVGFIHPVILGYLAGCALQQGGNLAAIVAQSSWTGKDLALHYLAVNGNVSSLLGSFLQDVEEPLFRNLFVVARWLKDAPPRASWRGVIMRKLAELIQRELLPMSVRQKALAGLVSSNDPGVSLLFRQFLESQSSSLRLLGALGCGAMLDQKTVAELYDLLRDPEPPVQYAAALALACLGVPAGIEALVFVLRHDEEDLRRAAAEALARNPTVGHPLLKEAAVSEDILVRRAAVFGLIQVNQAWAAEILDKMRLEDGQWVVRSAAEQAIEVSQQLNPRVPRPLPIPSQSPWLITYASKQGIGIQPGSEPTDLIIEALKKGTEEEKLAALDYLKNNPEEGIIGAILVAIYTDAFPIREAAANALWWITVSGATIPSPKQFGLT